ncbi:MAG TPA: hypothetical protein VGG74_08095 [Kofleriaceae bacterium]
MKRLLLLVACSSCMLPGQTGPGAAGPSSSGSGPSASADPSAAASDPSAPAPPPSAAAAPAGPVSVTIRSSCPNTVKVFFGEKPGFSSGTFSSIESNSVQSHSFRPGEQLWIVDDSENGVGSPATIGADTHELEVASSCTSIAAR